MIGRVSSGRHSRAIGHQALASAAAATRGPANHKRITHTGTQGKAARAGWGIHRRTLMADINCSRAGHDRSASRSADINCTCAGHGNSEDMKS